MIYTVKDVIAATGIGHSSVCKWLRDGRFPAKRVNKRWEMDEEAFTAVCDHARERLHNTIAEHINSSFTVGAFSHVTHSQKYQNELAERNQRERRQRLGMAIRRIKADGNKNRQTDEDRGGLDRPTVWARK